MVFACAKLIHDAKLLLKLFCVVTLGGCQGVSRVFYLADHEDKRYIYMNWNFFSSQVCHICLVVLLHTVGLVNA